MQIYVGYMIFFCVVLMYKENILDVMSFSSFSILLAFGVGLSFIFSMKWGIFSLLMSIFLSIFLFHIEGFEVKKDGTCCHCEKCDTFIKNMKKKEKDKNVGGNGKGKGGDGKGKGGDGKGGDDKTNDVKSNLNKYTDQTNNSMQSLKNVNVNANIPKSF